MIGFEDLPSELRIVIYKLICPRDTNIIITSKAIRKGNLMSRFCPAFLLLGSNKTLGEYRYQLRKEIADNRQQVHVNIVNFNFKQFGEFFKYFEKLANSRRFHVPTAETPDNSRHWQPLDYRGAPYFAANLVFDRNFIHDETPLIAWTKRSTQIQKSSGYPLRVLYKVVQADDTAALAEMLATVDFHESSQGQRLFIKTALQNKFAPISATAMHYMLEDGQAWDMVDDPEEDAALGRMLFGPQEDQGEQNEQMDEAIGVIENDPDEVGGGGADVAMASTEGADGVRIKEEEEEEEEGGDGVAQLQGDPGLGGLAAFPPPALPPTFAPLAGLAGLPSYPPQAPMQYAYTFQPLLPTPVAQPENDTGMGGADDDEDVEMADG